MLCLWKSNIIKDQVQTIMEKTKYLMIKQQCILQSKKFIKWDQKRNYSIFHSSHYDWWAFPIDQPSSYGTKYMVTAKEIDILIKDKQFISALQINAQIVCKAWGYDLKKGQNIQSSSMEQKWQKWPIRLYKMARSLQLFGLKALHMNCVKYAMKLIQRGEYFKYLGRRLDEYFFERKDISQNVGKNICGDQQKIQNQAIMDNQKQGKTQTYKWSKIVVINNQKKDGKSREVKLQFPGETQKSMDKLSQSNQGRTDHQFSRPKKINNPVQSTKTATDKKQK